MLKMIPTSVRVNAAKKSIKAAKAAFNSRVESTVNTLTKFAVLCSRVHRRRSALLIANITQRTVSDEELAQYTACMNQYKATERMRKAFYLDEQRSWSAIVIDAQENELKRMLSMSDEEFFAERRAILETYRRARRDIRPLIAPWLAMSTLRDNAKRAAAANLVQSVQVWNEVTRPRSRRFAFLTQPRLN